MALALTHHIVLTEGIPFALFAAFLHTMLKDGGTLLLEFVPPNDSQVKRMTAARPDLPATYSLPALREGFADFFEEQEEIPVDGSLRTLILFTKKERASA